MSNEVNSSRMARLISKKSPFAIRNMMMLSAIAFWMVSIQVSSAQQQQQNELQASPSILIAPKLPSYNFLPTNGPIDDARCTIEDLEQANDSQLYSILMDLRKTNFFNNFVVDLSASCPLQTSWRKGGGKDDKGRAAETVEEEEFECPSAKKIDLDPGTPSLCELQESNPFDSNPFDSNTFLFSISKDGFQSKEQEQTFDWKQQTDIVVNEGAGVGATSPSTTSATASTSSSFGKEEECGDEQVLPDSFWMDMCHRLDGTTTSSGTTVVNLALNPEHNTGYNGTHIWKAIYEENCAATSNGEGPEAMCLEERVLYRMLSGLHTSTTVAIAMRYNPPSVRKKRKDWQANATYFIEKLGNQPDYIRNLHFSYVVLLRALQKASPFLYGYDIRTGDIVQDETATVLLRRLLDSDILTSCQSVFSGFDESKMWLNTTSFPAKLKSKNVALEKQTFKGIFHNISSILDCVQCQQCKLHGKMSMLGYGTALRILFTSSASATSPTLKLGRNEIVALINTLAKLSESIKHVRELTHLYLEEQGKRDHLALPLIAAPPDEDRKLASSIPVLSPTTDLADVALGLTAKLSREGSLSSERETELVRMIFARNDDILLLAKHYGNDANKFLQFSHFLPPLSVPGLVQPSQLTNVFISEQQQPDAIIVGSGLAGLTAALNILDRGGRVIILEKEHLLGGNSNKASSGINACCFEDGDPKDSVKVFERDTIKSAGSSAQLELIETLVNNSGTAVRWLKERVGVDLSLRAQLGGHSHKRTHRPKNGMVGAEVIYGMQKAVKSYEKLGKVDILVDSKVVRLLTEGGRVVGVEYMKASNDRNQTASPTFQIRAPNVVLATGGFAADRTNSSLLAQYRPELMSMATTAGKFSTGDGITLATSLGAGLVDMDKIQVHPTGWVDPKDPDKKNKVLAAELMRGVGGILINRQGKRFCNELGTRAYVTEKMLSQDKTYLSTKKWRVNADVPTFFMVLSSSAADDGRKHVDHYIHKGLMTKLKGVSALAQWTGIPKPILATTLSRYIRDAKRGRDEFGKDFFPGRPKDDLDGEVFYAGIVTPVLHYCMGGVTIDSKGNVLDEVGNIIPGLHAVGEVTGGVHGNNRLGGNSLLECTVFGTIVGQKIPVAPSRLPDASRLSSETVASVSSQLKLISREELQRHNKPGDCWVAIYNVVYDLTAFALEHPAGAQSIFDLAGKDGTEAFEAVHNQNMLNDFEDDKIGMLLVESPSKNNGNKRPDEVVRGVTLTELKNHNQAGDCWVAFHGQVYNMSSFAPSHPGGEQLILSVAGTDGTNAFDNVHSTKKLKLVEEDRIGTLLD